MGIFHWLPSMGAPASDQEPAQEKKSKLPIQAIGIAVSPAVSVFMLALNKCVDVGAAYMGYPPIDKKQRIEEQRHAVQRVVAIRDDFLLTEPSPASRQAWVWLRSVEQLQKDDSRNFQEYMNGHCFTTWRCAKEATNLTKRAHEAAAQFKELGLEAKPRPHPFKGADWKDPSMVSSPYKEKLISYIMDRSERSNCLGLWGMAGVGKTALLRHVARCFSESAGSDTSFKVLSVDVGIDCTVAKVQKTICGLLGLTPAADVTEWGMSYAICNRLSGMNFLLILDDLSSPLDLARLGIPDPSGNHILPHMPEYPGPTVIEDPQTTVAGLNNPVPDDADSTRPELVTADLDAIRSKVMITCQKIVITTNRQSVCASMGCHQIIQMLPPNETDAMEIFSHAVGIDVMKDKRFTLLARLIMKECGYLPEALCKVGRSLSIKKSPEEWRLALKMLRQGKLSMVTYKADDLIARLKRSYDDLDESVKECFLVCLLWNEDENVPIDTLIQMWRGRGLVDESDGHAEGYAYVRMLQQVSLLDRGQNNLRSNEHSHVRMNGMIRQVAMQILTDKEVKWAVNTSSRPALTEAAWLATENAWIRPKDAELLSRSRFLKTKMLSKVTMLVTRCPILLSRCNFEAILFLDMASVKLSAFPEAICCMKTLEYLNMTSTEISAVPLQLGDLTNLKSLRLRLNPELKNIPEGLMVQLGKMKELDLFGTGCLLTPSLKKELEASDFNHLAVGVTLRSEIEVEALTQLCSGRVSTLYICLENFNSASINLNMFSSCEKLRELRIIDCKAVSLVAQRQDQIEEARSILNSLRSIEILSVPRLTEINLRTSGLNLTSVSICYAIKLAEITWISELVNLEQLYVDNCIMITTLVSSSMTDLEEVNLPRLKSVCLAQLPELARLSELPMKLESLVHFGVMRCGKLTELPDKECDPKVILDCDEEFWGRIEHDDRVASFIVRVDGNRRVLED